MACPNHPSSDPRPEDPAAPAPAPAPARRVPWATAAVLVFLSANLALCVRRVGGGDPSAVAFVVLTHLNLLLLFSSTRRFDLSPPGSAARGRARLSVWLLTASLTAAFTWKMAALLPAPLAIAAWIMGASTVGGGFYVLFVHEAK